MDLFLIFKTLILMLWQIFYASTLNGYTLIDKDYSYIHFQQWKMDDTGLLKFKFKTHNDYGLLLYTDNSKLTGYHKSYVSLKLNQGYLEFIIQMGAEDYKSKRRLRLGSALNDLKWHHVEIRRDSDDPRTTYIKLDELDLKSIVNDGEADELGLNSGLYFGGISNDMTDPVDGSLKLEPRLIGCIDDIQFKSGKNATGFISPMERSDGAKPGCLNACVKNACPNGGRCKNIFTSFQCDCVGTGFTGPTCEKEADLLSFDGQTRIEVEVPHSLRSTSNNVITFRFKSRDLNGLLMAAWSRNDYLMIELKDGVICMSINLGGGYHLFRINDQIFSDGKWHFVSVKRTGRDVFFSIDNMYTLNKSTGGQFSKFDLRNKLYIGGHPIVTKLDAIQSGSKANFKGCIQELKFNNLDVIYKVLYTRSNHFYLNGTKKTTCSVKKPKVITNRDTKDPQISESQKPTQEKKPTAASNPVQKNSGENKTLSKSSVTWIVVGLVCGTLVLIVTVIIIVHNVKHRYSGVFLSAHVKEQYNKQIATDGTGGTLLYTPKNGKIVIEPHLV